MLKPFMLFFLRWCLWFAGWFLIIPYLSGWIVLLFWRKGIDFRGL